MSKINRFGMNLGGNDFDGAGVLLANMIPNPGFEAGIFRMRSQVEKGSTQDIIRQQHVNPSWGGKVQPEGFWDNAEMRVEYAGGSEQFATVVEHYYDGEAPDLRNAYKLAHSVSSVANGQQFVLSKDYPPTHAALPASGSLGAYSLRREPNGIPTSPLLTYYWDMFGMHTYKEAGRMFDATGKWTFKFWARTALGTQRIRVAFGRLYLVPFVNETVVVSEAWKLYTLEFRVHDPHMNNPIAGLVLQVFNEDQTSAVYFDDLELYQGLQRPYVENGIVFCEEAINAIQDTDCSVLRYMGPSHGQQGRDFRQEVCNQFQRGRNEFRTNQSSVQLWSYNLGEFLDLCKFIGVTPWYCIPSAFDRSEVNALAEYLEETWEGEIIIEADNEKWGSNSGGDPFMGGSFGNHQAYARWARHTLTRFSDMDNTVLVMGGQAGWTGAQDLIIPELAKVPAPRERRAIALAPYYGVLSVADTLESIYHPLYATALSRGLWETTKTQADGVCRVFVYETNFHCDKVKAGLEEAVRVFTASRAGGLALSMQLLNFASTDGQELVACPYQLLQHSVGPVYSRIWGLMRDLHLTGYQRPSLVLLSEINTLLRNYPYVSQLPSVGSIDVPAINGHKVPTTIPEVVAWRLYQSDTDMSLPYVDVVFNLLTTKEIDWQVTERRRFTAYATFTGGPEDNNESSNVAQVVSLQRDSDTDVLATRVACSVAPLNCAIMHVSAAAALPKSVHYTVDVQTHDIRHGEPVEFEREIITVHVVSPSTITS